MNKKYLNSNFSVSAEHPENAHKIPKTFPEGSQRNSQNIPRRFPEGSQKNSQNIPRTFPEKSKKAQKKHKISQINLRRSPKKNAKKHKKVPESCPAPKLVQFQKTPRNVPSAFPSRFSEKSRKIPEKIPENCPRNSAQKNPKKSQQIPRTFSAHSQEKSQDFWQKIPAQKRIFLRNCPQICTGDSQYLPTNFENLPSGTPRFFAKFTHTCLSIETETVPGVVRDQTPSDSIRENLVSVLAQLNSALY